MTTKVFMLAAAMLLGPAAVLHAQTTTCSGTVGELTAFSFTTTPAFRVPTPAEAKAYSEAVNASPALQKLNDEAMERLGGVKVLAHEFRRLPRIKSGPVTYDEYIWVTKAEAEAMKQTP